LNEIGDALPGVFRREEWPLAVDDSPRVRHREDPWATRLYSNDGDMRAYGTEAEIEVVSVAESPLPPCRDLPTEHTEILYEVLTIRLVAEKRH
jgi:hypothetical protein